MSFEYFSRTFVFWILLFFNQRIAVDIGVIAGGVNIGE